MNNGLAMLLARTNLRIPIEEFFKEIEINHPNIGKIQQFKPINEGYEDANILLTTSVGKYVTKIFFKGRTVENIRSYIRILQEAQKIGVPVPVIRAWSEKNVPYCITEFFDGHDFQEEAPSLGDMLQIVGFLAVLNTLDFPVIDCYDSWGNKNFIAEYGKNKGKLEPKEDALIAGVVNDMLNLDFSKFTNSVIHGDMQRKHVLKNAQGKYCLLDFGCAANGPKVIELSTYLAWFCLSMPANIIEAYSSVHHLSQYELDALPILVRAVYAAYYLRTCILIKEGDRSEETAEWNRNAFRMLASGMEF